MLSRDESQSLPAELQSQNRDIATPSPSPESLLGAESAGINSEIQRADLLTLFREFDERLDVLFGKTKHSLK